MTTQIQVLDSDTGSRRRKRGFFSKLFSCFRTKSDSNSLQRKNTHGIGVAPRKPGSADGKTGVRLKKGSVDPSVTTIECDVLDIESDNLVRRYSVEEERPRSKSAEQPDPEQMLSSESPVPKTNGSNSPQKQNRVSTYITPKHMSLPLPNFELSTRYRPQVFPRLPPQRPEHRGKKLLILDMDETLVHSTFSQDARNPPGHLKPDATFFVPLDGMSTYTHIYKRPYLDAFLDLVCDEYEVAVFTASVSYYADKILDIIDPEHRIPHRLFRQHCTLWKGAYLKDISICNRDLSQVIIVDNSPTSFLFNWRNAIPILTWIDDMTDTELNELASFLSLIAPPTIKDIRPVISRSCGDLVAETVSQIWLELSRVPDTQMTNHSGSAQLAWQAQH